jgi:hypothetical protein
MDPVVVAAGGQQVTPKTERDLGVVPASRGHRQPGNDLARVHVPKAHTIVPAARGQDMAARMEGDARNHGLAG